MYVLLLALSYLEVTQRCSTCHSSTPESMLFCKKCRRRLFPKTKYDISPATYAYPPDVDNLEILKNSGPLPHLVKNLFLQETVNKLESKTRKNAHRVDDYSPLTNMIRECADILGLDVLPEVYIQSLGNLNAFTFGTDQKPIVVLDSNVEHFLNFHEILALLTHEFAHIRSGHMLYHTLAEFLVKGISFSSSMMGFGFITMPLQMALLSWRRESEVTADRASLVVVGSLDTLKSLMSKLVFSEKPEYTNKEIRKELNLTNSISELFRTHPVYTRRLQLLSDFYKSPDYKRVKRKLSKRMRISKAFVKKCRFCGSEKRASDLFCKKCGKSNA